VLWRLTLRSFRDGLRYLSNFYCLPGRAGGSPNGLAGATHELLRRQLGRAHAGRSETIQGVRGRVDFGTSLRRATFWHGAVDCAFSDPSVDTLRNRILLATLQALASSANLLLAYEQERENALRQELRSLARMLGSVSLVPISSSDFSRLQLGRNDRG
jgi:5-methylcytosine-specific restriction enzyme subunit McrC